MAFIGSYDTDDLTQRQYHYFCKLGGKKLGGTLDSVCFLRYCVSKNYHYGLFDNYDGDCDWLLVHPEKAARLGIDLESIYK